MLTVVLGGARSGKSRYAQVLGGNGPVVYLATARPDDDPEMQARIARHQAMRPSTWVTIEEPVYVAAALTGAQPADALVIVDCVTLWISNLLWEHRALSDDAVERVVLEQVDALTAAAGPREVVFVTNDVGSGIVPEHRVGRLFRDVQGLANQQLTRAAERVVWLVAGLPVVLKDDRLQMIVEVRG